MLQAALPEVLADALAAGPSARHSFSSRLGRALHLRIDTCYGEAGWHLEFAGNDARSGTAQYRVAKNEPEQPPDPDSMPDTENTEEAREQSADFADFADFSATPKGFSQSDFTEKGYIGEKKSAKSAKSADQSGSGFTPGREILNSAPPIVEGTAARVPDPVQVGIPAEPVDIEVERERRSDPKRQAITPAILSGAYKGADWFNPEADTPAYLQALIWACGDNPTRIKGWSVPAVINAFKDNGLIGLEWRGHALTARGFATELRAAYRAGNDSAVYKMAKTLGADTKLTR